MRVIDENRLLSRMIDNPETMSWPAPDKEFVLAAAFTAEEKDFVIWAQMREETESDIGWDWIALDTWTVV